MVKHREINWDYWRNLNAVEPWEACALSLDIDPDSMWPDRQGYLVGPGALSMYGPQPNDKTIETLVEFNLRLNRLTRYINDRQFLSSAESGKLTLTHFVDWLRAMAIDHIPLALAELHPTPEEQAQWNDINAWLDANPDISRRQNLLDASSKLFALPANESAEPRADTNQWKRSALRLGQAVHAEHPKWNVEQIAKEVANRLATERVSGRGGVTLKWETVKRHALKGIKRLGHSGIAPPKANAPGA